MNTVNFAISRNKAISLKRRGFGKSLAIVNYNLHILSFIDLQELTQLVAISAFRAKKESRNFYSILCNEIAEMGLYRNRHKEVFNFNLTDLKEDLQIKQLHNLYCAVGFDLFYEHLNISAPRSTVQKWTWKCFAKRKNETRLSIRDKRKIKKILKAGGKISFSKTTSSVYITNNEVEIRIADHSADGRENFNKIQITYVNRN